MRPAKTQISLGIRPVWSVSSLSAWRKLGSLATHWVHSEDWSDWASDLSFHWTHMSFCWFCYVEAKLVLNSVFAPKTVNSFWVTNNTFYKNSQSVTYIPFLWSNSCSLNRKNLLILPMSHSMTKPTKWHVHPAKTPISLCIRTVWSESLLGAQKESKEPRFLHADSKDWSDWADGLGWSESAGCTGHFVGFVVLLLIFTSNTGHNLLGTEIFSWD